jgi:competence protein ComEC
MIKSLLIESSCAHMTTLPLIMWRFDNVSIIAPIANLFVLPTIPLAMLLSFATGLIGALAPWWLAAWVALPAIGLLGLCVAAAQWFAALPFAAAKLSLDGPLVAGFYLGIMVFSWVMWRRQRGFSQGLESSRISTLHM